MRDRVTLYAVHFPWRWLDRLWLVLIALAFVLMAPIWAILMAERFGWGMVIGGVAIALLIRYRSSLV